MQYADKFGRGLKSSDTNRTAPAPYIRTEALRNRAGKLFDDDSSVVIDRVADDALAVGLPEVVTNGVSPSVLLYSV